MLWWNVYFICILYYFRFITGIMSDQWCHADNCIHWCTNIMWHIGQEICFRLICIFSGLQGFRCNVLCFFQFFIGLLHFLHCLRLNLIISFFVFSFLLSKTASGNTVEQSGKKQKYKACHEYCFKHYCFLIISQYIIYNTFFYNTNQHGVIIFYRTVSQIVRFVTFHKFYPLFSAIQLFLKRISLFLSDSLISF